MKTPGSWLVLLAITLAGCNNDPKAVSRKYVERGNQYFSGGKYQEAYILYRRALNKDLRSPDAWYRLGLVNAKLKALPEARRDFSRAMELDPANRDAAIQLGDLDLAFYLLNPPGGRTFLADLDAITQRLLKQDPESFDALRFSGNIALAKSDTAGAIKAFETANLAKPDQPDLVLTLIQTLFASKQDEAGEKLADGLIERGKAFPQLYDALYVHYLRGGQVELAEQVLQKKISNNPGRGLYLIQLASHYFLVHRPADVQATITRLTSDPTQYRAGRLEAGDFFVRILDYPAALAQFESGEEQNPKAARVYRKRIAEVLATQGRRNQAQSIVADLLKGDAKDPEVRALHAALELASGNTRQVRAALTELKELTSAMPSSATLHFNLGRAYQASTDQQNLELARNQFEMALRLDPHHSAAKLAWAQLAVARGESARALEAAGEVSREDPANTEARLIQAGALVKMGEFEKARLELTNLLQISPDSADARDQLAELDLRENRFAPAEEGFRGLIAQNDTRGTAGLIQSKIAQRQWPEAIQLANGQLQRSPDRQDYREKLAQIYAASGNFSAAASQFEVLIAKDPKSSGLYVQLGEAKARGGDATGALAAFQTARQLAPRDPAAALDLALLYDQAGRSQEARAEYEIVIQLQPDNTAALNNLAYLDAEAGVDLDQALAHAQRAQQRSPDDPNVQDTLALVYIRKNLTNEGVRMLRHLVSRDPSNPAFHIHLALALYQKGDRPLAKRELETASHSNPNTQQQVRIKELLAKI